MMKKVKFFKSSSRYSLENDINDFALTHEIYGISYSAYRCGYSTYYSCCVTYIVED